MFHAYIVVVDTVYYPVCEVECGRDITRIRFKVMGRRKELELEPLGHEEYQNLNAK